jgi:hypothetical protein
LLIREAHAARDTPGIIMRNLREMYAPYACQRTIQGTLQFMGIRKHCKQKCLKLLPIHGIAKIDWVNCFSFVKKEIYI